MKAIGGESALSGLGQLKITAKGANRVNYEHGLPDELIETGTYARTYTFDVPGEKLRVDTRRQQLFEGFQFGPPQSFTRVVDGDVGAITPGVVFTPAGPLPSESVAALRRQQVLFNPHFLLREALERPELIGDGGTVRHNGRRHRILTIADDVAEIRLFINQRTALISKLETTESNPLARDTAVEVHYDGWRLSGPPRPNRHRQPLLFPRHVELHAGGLQVWEETRTRVRVGPSLGDDHFDLPPEAGSPVADPEALAFGEQSHHLVEGFFALGFLYNLGTGLAPPAELAPGVTLFASGANSMVVEYDDGLVVIEAPNTPTHGDDIVAAASQLAPGKPITHVIQSHHHIDHAAGVRSLVAAGATAVVGNGVGDFWHDVLAAPSTVRPDALSGSGVTGAVEELDFGGSFFIGDDSTTVTTHHLENKPHADDMVIITIETDGQVFVFEADLYNAGTGFNLAIGGPAGLFEGLRNLGIIDEACASAVPLTIVPAHGFPQSLEDSLTELAGLGIDVGC